MTFLVSINKCNIVYVVRFSVDDNRRCRLLTFGKSARAVVFLRRSGALGSAKNIVHTYLKAKENISEHVPQSLKQCSLPVTMETATDVRGSY
jgi:hypothetical protein